MNIPATHRRRLAITFTAFVLVIAFVGAISYWIMTRMPNPARDGFLLLALTFFAIAASLWTVAVALEALIAGGWSSRRIQNVAKTAKYLALLKLVVAIVWIIKALTSA